MRSNRLASPLLAKYAQLDAVAHARPVAFLLPVLGETPPQHYAVGGPYVMAFTADEIDISALKRHVLTNVGLLQAILYSGVEEVVQISCVTQVTQQTEEEGGGLVRSVFSPLD